VSTVRACCWSSSPYERKLDRISDLWGPKLARSLARVERRGGGLELEAFIGPLHDNRSGSDYQQLFVNGRAVRSPVVMAALQDAFHLVLPKGRLPVTVLYLNMPAQDVDVNVHPTKAEVRFHSPATIRDFVVRSIGEHLGSGARGMVPEMHLNRDRNEQIRLTLDSVYPARAPDRDGLRSTPWRVPLDRASSRCPLGVKE
jgi:DNA mismatch repair ATPase MutL